MLAPPDLDPLAVRRQFARRAATAERADFLLREIEQRMLGRLDLVKITPASIVDVGCGRGLGLLALKQRYPQARLLGIDSAPAVAQRARQTLAPPGKGFLARLRAAAGTGSSRGADAAQIVAADAQALPLPASFADLVWSNLALHWFADPLQAIAEWQRVIRPQGLLGFSFFGVDTFIELRRAGARLMAFHDMHDIGDALVHAGFADPVLDTERLMLQWLSPEALLSDLQTLGGNALRGRFRGLLGRGQRAEWLAAIEGLRGADGNLRMSVEVVYGHAWCPARKRLPQGLAPLQFVPRRRPGASTA
ncbi:MAG: methyltransferase domain-containing protein [Burkholderiales bacterium]|nr:methyltransferase domain-containing protein [Burkholderiales bacterium]